MTVYPTEQENWPNIHFHDHRQDFDWNILAHLTHSALKTVVNFSCSVLSGGRTFWSSGVRRGSGRHQRWSRRCQRSFWWKRHRLERNLWKPWKSQPGKQTGGGKAFFWIVTSKCWRAFPPSWISFATYLVFRRAAMRMASMLMPSTPFSSVRRHGDTCWLIYKLFFQSQLGWWSSFLSSASCMSLWPPSSSMVQERC